MENKFVNHYLDLKSAGIFLSVAFAGLLVILFILFSFTKKYQDEDETEVIDKKGRKKKRLSQKSCWFIESFYELVFSSTSILFFLGAYYLIDRYLDIFEYRKLWDQYRDVLLMAFIFMSVFLNVLLDHLFVHIKTIHSDQKASIRLVSTIYMILIFVYIRFIYDDLNYNELIVYFLGLVMGRFLFFDFTWKDFKKTVANVIVNLPLLLLMIIYSGLMCYVGFKSNFLLTANGVIVSIFIAHLFMDISIFLVHSVLRHMRTD